MSKEIYISSTPHETRLAIVEDEVLTEIYYERENEYTLAGSIYNGRVTRVLPGMQSSFVDIGLERDAFLYITDFMEEAPDSDEFDTTSSSDRPPRTIQGERAASPVIRTDSEARSPERDDRGGRGRRGGRDRDRNRNQDRGPIERAPSSDQATTDRPDTPRLAEPGFTPPDTSDSSEVGEGAPGADGNRRWRGRRGRRRGRGIPGQSSDPVLSSTDPTDAESVRYPEDDPAFDPDSYRPIEASAAPPEVAAAPGERTFERTSERTNEQSRRNEGRGPRRERFDSPRQPEQQRPEQRTPRGFAPSRDLYGVDSGSSTGPIANAYPDADAASTPEPLILPGESLSKYRKGDAPAASSAAVPAASAHAIPVTLAPPKNLYTVAEGWDGGAVLPGETLSRRRPAESSSQSENRRPQRDFDSRREARHEGRRDNRSEFRNTPPAAEATHFTAPGEADRPLPQASEFTPEHVAANVAETVETPAPIDNIEVPMSAVPDALPIFVPEPVKHVETDYEPHEASASYRVDPVAPSEFRQSGSTLEPPVELEEPTTAPTSTHTITPVPSEHPAKLHSDIDAVAADSAEPAVAAHDVTSIAASGEMISEPIELVPEAAHHPAPIDTPEPASPIRHEGAVVSTGVAADFITPTGSFVPGSGQIDEEILDDEDSEGTTLHASSIEEMDDLEEETLEGAADLGTMLREMSIDHITRTSPEAEEDDDLEEDDLDEDDEEDDEDEEEEDEEGGQEGFQLDRSNAEQSGDLDRDQAARSGSPDEAAFFQQQFGQEGDENRSEDRSAQPGDAPHGDSNRDRGRESDRRGGRRDGRRGRSDRGGDRNRSSRTGHSNGHGRHSMQSTNLPAISDLLKPGQEILVQIAKEPIAKKGARITSHIALPGRFLVFMPTVNHTGVSRKIESDGERRRLKEILLSEKGDASGGFIVRTAAEGATEEELRSDLRFLLNLWADIKARSESSKSPALIYHDLNLVERILRDQVTDNFSAIWVDTEDAYERVLRFLQRFQPSLIRRVKLYLKDTPLFEQFGITEEINKALRSKVWLKSGGSIVINQTEALVAIDINTGKFVGKTARLEDTIVKTNLDAIPEIVRQIRLRDLGGIIIIDFIDMDERKNRNRVMAALEDELKSDRAPSKVLQFNDFGLVAITRKRVKQSLERTLSTTCAVCTGTGMVKSPVTVCNDIYIEMRKMHKHLDRGDVMLRVHPEVVKQLKSSGAKWLQEMEEMAGKTILVKSDPSLHPEQFDIH
jgi:ribonuclease G